MDAMLLKFIMLLSVSFFECMLNAGLGSLYWTVLVVPFSLIVLALGLKWMSADAIDDGRQKAGIELFIAQLDDMERLIALCKEVRSPILSLN